MKKSQGEATIAKNLEDKFDRGEDVLDYFDVRKARVINAQSKGSAGKKKFAYPARRNLIRGAAAILEKTASYYNKK
jgi:hypothetical protein